MKNKLAPPEKSQPISANDPLITRIFDFLILKISNPDYDM